jgi:hypothetical protein
MKVFGIVIDPFWMIAIALGAASVLWIVWAEVTRQREKAWTRLLKEKGLLKPVMESCTYECPDRREWSIPSTRWKGGSVWYFCEYYWTPLKRVEVVETCRCRACKMKLKRFETPEVPDED